MFSYSYVFISFDLVFEDHIFLVQPRKSDKESWQFNYYWTSKDAEVGVVFINIAFQSVIGTLWINLSVCLEIISYQCLTVALWNIVESCYYSELQQSLSLKNCLFYKKHTVCYNLLK